MLYGTRDRQVALRAGGTIDTPQKCLMGPHQPWVEIAVAAVFAGSYR